MSKNRPQLTVIQNDDEQALRAYYRRLYMIEKYILHVMLECDVQIQYRLIHPEIPRSCQGRIRFNGGIALGFNPYSGLPSVFYTPLGAVDISRGFSVRENAAQAVFRVLSQRLGLSEMPSLKSIVPGVIQQICAVTKDPFGNALPRACMLKEVTVPEDDSLISTSARCPEIAITLWEKVRLHQEPSVNEQLSLSTPRGTTLIQAVA